MNLNDIYKMIADSYEPAPDPFNGATRLVLAPDVFRALAPEIEAYATNPLLRPRIEIDVWPTLPPKHGMGFRPWRKGDDPEVQFMGEVMAWFLAPKTETEPKD